jgi:hypothetical protein
MAALAQGDLELADRLAVDKDGSMEQLLLDLGHPRLSLQWRDAWLDARRRAREDWKELSADLEPVPPEEDDAGQASELDSQSERRPTLVIIDANYLEALRRRLAPGCIRTAEGRLDPKVPAVDPAGSHE